MLTQYGLYSLDSVNSKAKGLVSLVNTINANSRVIDGIGSQTHLSVSSFFSPHKVCNVYQLVGNRLVVQVALLRPLNTLQPQLTSRKSLLRLRQGPHSLKQN